MKTLTALALLTVIAGCNTVEGLGRDLAIGGEAIEDAAVEAQRPEPQPVARPVPQRQPVYTPQPAPRPVPQQQPVYTPQPASPYIY